uniref:Uncharacterized protein n=1 Tax=Meloidogyne hapla TaxID=6305 RepID=A0A1I8BL72_MELHA
MLKVSAVRTNYRSLLRSSSIHEPSDPPSRTFTTVSATPRHQRQPLHNNNKCCENSYLNIT